MDDYDMLMEYVSMILKPLWRFPEHECISIVNLVDAGVSLIKLNRYRRVVG